ncbi:50S ribosomal protein L4 [Clostridiales bacterium COT073_COT-073]|nr:50S ribosomal protein L4 [Clostridiales bacterium COT073_COT-073]
MAKVSVLNMQGKKVEEIELNDSVFGLEANDHVVYRAVVTQLANSRQGTQSALTRGEVRGGGIKPWRQKGTGRARQGSIRAPQWTGGGVVFAPKPRDYSKRLNKKERQLALKVALSEKVRNGKLIVLDTLEFNEIKTKNMASVLNALEVVKGLIVLADNNQNVVLSARNIPNTRTIPVNNINIYDLLKYEKCVITKDAVKALEEVYA